MDRPLRNKTSEDCYREDASMGCGFCGQPIAPGEPLIRSYYDHTLWQHLTCIACGEERGTRSANVQLFGLTCAQCGRRFLLDMGSHGRRKSCCSELCECAWACARKQVARQTHKCGWCSNNFSAKRGARYCSHACRQSAYRSRHGSIARELRGGRRLRR